MGYRNIIFFLKIGPEVHVQATLNILKQKNRGGVPTFCSIIKVQTVHAVRNE